MAGQVKVKMKALLTIPKRKMKAGEPYECSVQQSLDDIQFGRGEKVQADTSSPQASK
jgi:hypothetical protein